MNNLLPPVSFPGCISNIPPGNIAGNYVKRHVLKLVFYIHLKLLIASEKLRFNKLNIRFRSPRFKLKRCPQPWYRSSLNIWIVKPSDNRTFRQSNLRTIELDKTPKCSLEGAADSKRLPRLSHCCNMQAARQIN